MKGTQKLPVGEPFWNPAGQALEIPWLELSPRQEMTFQRLLTWPSEALASPSESFFYLTGLQRSQAVFSSARFPAVEFGGSKGLSSFSLLSVQADQVTADIFF